VSNGRWNRHLGWALLVAGFAAAVGLDPWSLSQRDLAAIVGSPRMAARHAQAVIVGMAFLQLMAAEILAAGYFPVRAARRVALLSGGGALIYVAGYVLQVELPGGAWLIVAGALLNFLAFAVLAGAESAGQTPWAVRLVLWVFCLGMGIDALMGLFAADPSRFLPTYLGPEDGVRQRMLRLARAAVVALSLLTLLIGDLAARSPSLPRTGRWGQLALAAGAAGMPLVLTLAALTWVEVKYLLPLPAQVTFVGTLAGVWLALYRARPLELWGWSLIALSMAAGLFMGLYAFDGPLPPPGFLGAYNDFPRRLSRLGHAYCIVLGLLSIFLARELATGAAPGGWQRLGVALLVAGTVSTVAGVLLLEAMNLPVGVLCVGPALVGAATVMCLVSPSFKGP
jgi:hypothetical protein